MPQAALVTKTQNLIAFDDFSSVMLVTEADLDGYEELSKCSTVHNNEIWAELRLVYRVQLAGQAALARLSCLWIRCHASKKVPKPDKLHAREKSCSVEADQLGNLGVDIHVY